MRRFRLVNPGDETPKDHERAVGVLQGGVNGQDRVVRLDNGRRELRRGVYAEFKSHLFSIVGAEALKEERTESGTSSTAEGVEHQESLKTLAVAGQTTDYVHNSIDQFLADGAVATRI